MLVEGAVKELRSDSPSQRIIDVVSTMLLIAECKYVGYVFSQNLKPYLKTKDLRGVSFAHLSDELKFESYTDEVEKGQPRRVLSFSCYSSVYDDTMVGSIVFRECDGVYLPCDRLECFEMEDAFKDGKVSFERLSNSSNYRGKDLGSYIALSNGFIYNTHGYYSSVSANLLADYLEAFHKVEVTYGVETIMNLILEQYGKCLGK